jgi:predicted nucleic acid-binding protein
VRVVLDTNLLLSALLSDRGPPARIVEAWRGGRFRLKGIGTTRIVSPRRFASFLSR